MVFLTLKIVFVLANTVDADEMPHYAVNHLGLHCLPKDSFKCQQYTSTQQLAQAP